MIKVEELFIAPTATVLETLRKLDETGQRILFIAPEGHLRPSSPTVTSASFSCAAAHRTRPWTTRPTIIR